MTQRGGALPTCLVIGAMKCGTSALHEQLGRHPQIAMAAVKELNFFFGPTTAPHSAEADWWRTGQWHRGREWYASQFDPDAPVRGETSPGYTDPSHPAVPERIRALVPDVRLVYLVRDPVTRAVSQWRHHVRDGTEPRPLDTAVLDPDSQYLARSRYAERLRPFRTVFPDEQVLVVVQERLLRRPHRELARVCAYLGADLRWWHDAPLGPGSRRAADPVVGDSVGDSLRRAVWSAVGDDVDSLRSMLADPLPEWCDPR